MISQEKLKKIKEQLNKEIEDLQEKINNPNDFTQLISLLQKREIFLDKKEKQILDILIDVKRIT